MGSKLCNVNYLYSIGPVVQWKTKALDGILHAGNRLNMKNPKTHEYMLLQAVGNNVYRIWPKVQHRNIQRDVWYF